MKKKTLAALLLDEEDDLDLEGRTPPALFIVPELLRHAAHGWIAVYHFFLGAEDGHATYLMGPLDSMTEEQAHTLLRAREPYLNQAMLGFLRAVKLETMH